MSPVIRRHLTAQVAISRYVANAIDGDAIVIPNGVPVCEAAARRERTVLVAQRFEEEKQTSLALDAWRCSSLRENGWRMLLAGEGSEEPALRNLASALGVADSVEFRGFSSNIGKELASAGLVLATAPSEPFGLTVVEAMACATPVVAAAGGAHLETVGAVDDKWLFPPGDARACARAMDDLARSDQRSAYGARLQQVQRQRFSLSTHVDALVELYHAVAPRRRQR